MDAGVSNTDVEPSVVDTIIEPSSPEIKRRNLELLLTDIEVDPKGFPVRKTRSGVYYPNDASTVYRETQKQERGRKKPLSRANSRPNVQQNLKRRKKKPKRKPWREQKKKKAPVIEPNPYEEQHKNDQESIRVLAKEYGELNTLHADLKFAFKESREKCAQQEKEIESLNSRLRNIRCSGRELFGELQEKIKQIFQQFDEQQSRVPVCAKEIYQINKGQPLPESYAPEFIQLLKDLRSSESGFDAIRVLKREILLPSDDYAFQNLKQRPTAAKTPSSSKVAELFESNFVKAQALFDETEKIVENSIDNTEEAVSEVLSTAAITVEDNRGTKAESARLMDRPTVIVATPGYVQSTYVRPVDTQPKQSSSSVENDIIIPTKRAQTQKTSPGRKKRQKMAEKESVQTAAQQRNHLVPILKKEQIIHTLPEKRDDVSSWKAQIAVSEIKDQSLKSSCVSPKLPDVCAATLNNAVSEGSNRALESANDSYIRGGPEKVTWTRKTPIQIGLLKKAFAKRRTCTNKRAEELSKSVGLTSTQIVHCVVEESDTSETDNEMLDTEGESETNGELPSVLQSSHPKLKQKESDPAETARGELRFKTTKTTAQTSQPIDYAGWPQSNSMPIVAVGRDSTSPPPVSVEPKISTQLPISRETVTNHVSLISLHPLSGIPTLAQSKRLKVVSPRTVEFGTRPLQTGLTSLYQVTQKEAASSVAIVTSDSRLKSVRKSRAGALTTREGKLIKKADDQKRSRNCFIVDKHKLAWRNRIIQFPNPLGETAMKSLAEELKCDPNKISKYFKSYMSKKGKQQQLAEELSMVATADSRRRSSSPVQEPIVPVFEQMYASGYKIIPSHMMNVRSNLISPVQPSGSAN